MPQSRLAATTDPNLAETAAALTRWRSTKPLGARIPEALWSRAVELASTHAVAKVARVLRLDYVRLKRRLMAEAEAAPPLTASSGPGRSWADKGPGSSFSICRAAA